MKFVRHVRTRGKPTDRLDGILLRRKSLIVPAKVEESEENVPFVALAEIKRTPLVGGFSIFFLRFRFEVLLDDAF